MGKDITKFNVSQEEARSDMYQALSQAELKKARNAKKQNAATQTKPNTPNKDGKPQPNDKPKDKPQQ